MKQEYLTWAYQHFLVEEKQIIAGNTHFTHTSHPKHHLLRHDVVLAQHKLSCSTQAN